MLASNPNAIPPNSPNVYLSSITIQYDTIPFPGIAILGRVHLCCTWGLPLRQYHCETKWELVAIGIKLVHPREIRHCPVCFTVSSIHRRQGSVIDVHGNAICSAGQCAVLSKVRCDVIAVGRCLWRRIYCIPSCFSRVHQEPTIHCVHVNIETCCFFVGFIEDSISSSLRGSL